MIVKPLTIKDIRKKTVEFRKHCHIDDKIYFSILSLFEQLANAGMFNYEIVEDDELENAYAQTNILENKIILRKSIYEMAYNNVPFGRSTIAHELFHLFYHNVENICLERTDKKYRKTIEDPEWQANCFAGELLVPKYMVEGMSVEEVMEKCCVSKCMATYQLERYASGK